MERSPSPMSFDHDTSDGGVLFRTNAGTFSFHILEYGMKV
jgi:hypothetical protein